jgi:hypothetical protein
LSVDTCIESQSQAEEATARVVEKLLPMTGIIPEQLVLRVAKEERDVYRKTYDQVIDGVPVENGLFSIVLNRTCSDHAHTFFLSNQFKSDITISTVPKITAEEAVKVAEGDLRDHWQEFLPIYGGYEDIPKGYLALSGAARLLIRSVGRIADEHGPHLCWRFGYGDAVYYIDAHTGQVVDRLPARIQSLITGAVATDVYGQDTASGYDDNGRMNGSTAPLGGIRVDWQERRYSDESETWYWQTLESTETQEGGHFFLLRIPSPNVEERISCSLSGDQFSVRKPIELPVAYSAVAPIQPYCVFRSW